MASVCNGEARAEMSKARQTLPDDDGANERINVTTKVLVMLEHFDDGQGEPHVFLDTPEGRAKMDAAFRLAVTDNIGERDFDGEIRELTEEEVAEEIEAAIQNDYDWSGWDCKVQTFFCEVE